MKSFQATWEDEENNRRVELVVNHRSDSTPVVTPTRVTFLCPTTKAPLRSIGVWTEAGRRVLARQIEANVKAGDWKLSAEEMAEVDALAS